MEFFLNVILYAFLGMCILAAIGLGLYGLIRIIENLHIFVGFPIVLFLFGLPFYWAFTVNGWLILTGAFFIPLAGWLFEKLSDWENLFI